MNLLETLGGEDWLKLVMGASQVKCWEKRVKEKISDFPRDYIYWSVNFLRFNYEKYGANYQILINKRDLLDSQGNVVNSLLFPPKISPKVEVTRYTLLTPNNIYNRVMSRDPNIRFRNPPTEWEIDPDGPRICVMVEKLTGLSLNPF